MKQPPHAIANSRSKNGETANLSQMKFCTSAHSQPTFLVNWQTSPCSQPTCLLWMCKTHHLLSTNFTSVNHTGLLSLRWNSAYRSKHFSNQLSSLTNWGVFINVYLYQGKDLGYLYCIFLGKRYHFAYFNTCHWFHWAISFQQLNNWLIITNNSFWKNEREGKYQEDNCVQESLCWKKSW